MRLLVIVAILSAFNVSASAQKRAPRMPSWWGNCVTVSNDSDTRAYLVWNDRQYGVGPFTTATVCE